MVVSQPWNGPNRLAYPRRSAFADNDIDFAIFGHLTDRMLLKATLENLTRGTRS